METFLYEHTVQYYETDKMDCVHHSNYIRWFEEARTFLLGKLGFGYFKMEENGVMSPVLRVEAEYKTMARYGDTAQIEVSADNYTGTRITFVYDIRDKATGALRCFGKTHHCFIGKDGRPLSLRKHLPQMDMLVKAYIDGML